MSVYISLKMFVSEKCVNDFSYNFFYQIQRLQAVALEHLNIYVPIPIPYQ